MSVQAMAWVLSNSKSTGAARLVLLSIANHVNPDGEGWVHVERVCREALVTRRTYDAVVPKLINSGELERIQGEGGGARMKDWERPNLYRFPAILQGGPPKILQGANEEPSREPLSKQQHPVDAPLVLSAAVAFDQVWKAYPRKERKAEARGAFCKLVKADDWNASHPLWQALKNYIRFLKENPQRPPMHLVTFLRAERWKDWVQGAPEGAAPNLKPEGLRSSLPEYMR